MSERPIAIVQARVGSTRLPGKVLRSILGRPILWHVVERVRHASGLAHVVVATTDRPADEPIRRLCEEHGITWFAGSERDVLDRFYRTALRERGDPLVRVTADCPLVDPELLTRLLALYRTGQYDHVGVATGAGALRLPGGRFPDGLDAECFSFAALERAWREATRPIDREHVTPYIWRNTAIFRCGHLTSERDYSQLRWTVDTEADFELVAKVYEGLYRPDRPFLMADVLRFLAAHPEVAALNRDAIGREGYEQVWDPTR